MSDISENEANEESLEVPLTKQKKPRSQAQIEAFERVKEKRRQNLEAKKQEKLINSAKLILEEETKKLLEPAIGGNAPSKTPPTASGIAPVKPPSRQSKKYGVKGERRVPRVEPEPEPETESESESEEEVIVVKKSKPVKKQKKVRKIIIEESSSEDEDDESEYEPEPPPRPQRKPAQFRLGSDQRPVVRVIRPNPNDFFC